VHAIGKLQKRFPAAFPKKPAPKLPLKIGILEDLLPHAQELSLNEAEIREAIATWCRGSRYWSCLTDAAVRVDLNGAPAGQVSTRDMAFARSLQRGGPRRPRNAEGAPQASADSHSQASAEPQASVAGQQAESEPQADEKQIALPVSGSESAPPPAPENDASPSASTNSATE
jgi:ProP effector